MTIPMDRLQYLGVPMNELSVSLEEVNAYKQDARENRPIGSTLLSRVDTTDPSQQQLKYFAVDATVVVALPVDLTFRLIRFPKRSYDRETFVCKFLFDHYVEARQKAEFNLINRFATKSMPLARGLFTILGAWRLDPLFAIIGFDGSETNDG